MDSHPSRLGPPLVRWAALCALAGPVAAQLDLPEKPAETSGPSIGGPKPSSDLDLPEAPPLPVPSGEGAEVSADDLLKPAPLDGPAAFVREEVRKLDDPEARLVRSAVTSLVGLGDEGLAGARRMIADDHPPTVTVGARTLLRAGSPVDQEAVHLLLAEDPPKGTAAPLLDAVLELDPARATPTYLVELLLHRRTAVRVAVQRVLRERVDPAWTPLLADALTQGGTDARLRTLELVSLAGGPDRRGLLVAALGDRASKVARRAAELLAIVEGEEAGPELAALWRDEGNATRERAYALLALAELEDRRGAAFLVDDDAAALLVDMLSTDALVATASAVALAGIGYRSTTPSATPWLDREVPHALVKAVSGDTFFADFSSVQSPARRRLELLAGESRGADGMAWRQWWLGAAPTFRAQRAWLEVGVASFAELVVVARLPEEPAFRLLGPTAAANAREDAVAGGPEAFYLAEEDARALFDALAGAEVFGAARLPGLRGRTGPGVRDLTVRLGEQEKRFTVGDNVDEPWFDGAVDAVRSARTASSWQRWPDPAKHASRRELWEEQRDWWAEPRPALARQLRTKELVLTHLRGLTSEAEHDLARRAAVEELATLYAQPDVADAADLPHLLFALAAEPFYSAQVAELTRLALVVGRVARGPEEPIGRTVGLEIVEALHERFRVDAGPEMIAVLLACEPAAALASAEHPSSYVRGAAAHALGRGGTEEGLTRLRALLDDRSPAVEAAAVSALGEAGDEGAREAILDRANESLPNVRIAALLAAARLGGEGVLEELYTGLISPDVGVQEAAAEGLAVLAEPASAPILVDLLRQGPRHPLFEHARDGLLRISEPAHAELLREAQSGTRAGRRESGLLLAHAGVAEAAPVLLMLFTEDKTDAPVAEELAILTAHDMRGAQDPALAWWDWWDAAPRGEALAWLVQATRAGLPSTPDVEALRGEGTLEGGRYLVQLLSGGAPHHVERARRELSRLLGRELDSPPSDVAARATWIEDLAAEVDARYGR